MTVNVITGEVDDWERDNDTAAVVMLPERLADLDEHDVAQAMPSPHDVAQALVASRTRIGRSVAVIRAASDRVRAAKRDLLLAKALARESAKASGEHRTEKDLDAAVILDDTVQQAAAELDDAAAALEYARLLKSGLWKDVEVLQSINANLRSEVAPGRAPQGYF